MEFVPTEQVEVPPERAARHLKTVLQQQGFANTTELPASKADANQQQDSSMLVIGYATELAADALAVTPEAPLLLTVTFLLRPSGNGTHVSVLDPQVLSVLPTEKDLQSVISDVRARTLEALKQLKATVHDQVSLDAASNDRAREVEQRLYAAIVRALEALSDQDLAQTADRIFVLAKAYAAIASLKRTEEIELHLA